MQKFRSLITVTALASLVLAACGTAPAAPTAAPPTQAPAPTEAPQPTEAPTIAAPTEAPTEEAKPTEAPKATEAPTEEAKPTEAPAAAAGKLSKICEVTDSGGIDDKSFNQTAWVGSQQAAKDLGGAAVYLESKQQTDYEKNITEFLNSKCDLIVTVGFLLGDATKAAAEANKDQKFQILDFAYDPAIPNVWGQVYATDQGAFLAGYVAAAMSKTGKVGTFGGINIPPVVDFMDGFALGVQYYNEKNKKDVKVLGWDVKKRDGLFTGNFTSTDDGRRLGETLMDEGADVILPVAGPVGLGTAAAIKERGNAMMIGVDTDQVISAPEFKDIILTSILKHLELSVQTAAKAVADGSFKGGTQLANLGNGEIGIAPFHNFDSQVPQQVKDDLKAITADIVAGKIKTKP